jgi:hypothetical protein
MDASKTLICPYTQLVHASKQVVLLEYVLEYLLIRLFIYRSIKIKSFKKGFLWSMAIFSFCFTCSRYYD